MHLLAQRVGHHPEGTGDPVLDGHQREHVEGAHPDHRHAEDRTEHPRGDQPDPQPGERARPDTDGDPVEIRPPDPGVPQHRLDRRREQLAVAAGVDRGALGQHPLAVGDGNGDRWGRGV